VTPLLALVLVFSFGLLIGCGIGIYVCERREEAKNEVIEGHIDEIERIMRRPLKPQCARCGTKCERCGEGGFS
jgi:hypothetical protein